MPSGLLSSLNIAFSFGLQRAVTVKQSQPLHLIEAQLSRKISSTVVFCSNCEVNRVKMSASGVAASGDLVVDNLVSSCGNFSTFVKPSGVYFNDRSYRICRKASVSMKYGEAKSHHLFSFKRRFHNFCDFSSSCYSDGIVPNVPTDESLSAEQLSGLALEDEKPPLPRILKLVSGACYLPHPAKESTGGEDAHFICAHEQAIGVADGVGGWADVGVNAGLYARELMENAVKEIQQQRAKGDGIDPLRVLEKAHEKTKAMGSSTACIIALKDPYLHAINLGDSGFIVVRDGCLIFESPVQQHSFNFTYQLENSNRADLPSSGQVFEISVAPGDVVVAGSDGLFDNLYNKEISSFVGDAVREGLGPDEIAKKIAGFARVRALDRKRQTPFSSAAQEAGFAYYGGKLDDLTIVVSFVSN